MKKIILFAVLITAIASCKKSDTGNPGSNNPGNSSKPDTTPAATNTIEATIDDTAWVFPNDVSAHIFPIGGGQDLTFTGDNTAGHTIQFSVSAPGTLTTGIYTDLDNPNYPVGIDYELEGYTYIFSNIRQVTSPFTVAITSLTSTSVEGTFDGIVYFGFDSTSESRKITNGKFNINF